MIYQIDESIKKIKVANIKNDVLTVGFITLDELEKYNITFGFAESTIAECKTNSKNLRSAIDVYDDYCFGIINLIDVSSILGERDKLGFYLKKNLFLVVHIIDDDQSTNALFENAVKHFKPDSITLEKVIYSFFERILYQDSKTLENMEFTINELEEHLNQRNVNKNFNNDILTMKKKLLILRNYYEQLIDIGEELQENENNIFNDSDLRYFKIFTDKVSRLSSNTQMLRESLVQLQEAYQASLEYNLNSILKVFTVITTIFLPLTLIVGWYGMNFTTMPELTWKYGYLSVIILSILVIISCIIFFKHKKLL